MQISDSNVQAASIAPDLSLSTRRRAVELSKSPRRSRDASV